MPSTELEAGNISQGLVARRENGSWLATVEDNLSAAND